MKVDIIAKEFKNFSEKDKKRFLDACDLCERILNSQEFSLRLLRSRMKMTEGYTNSEILDLILSKPFELHVEEYYSNGRVIGYTYPNSIWTWINKKFFDSFQLNEIAMNIAHEQMHKLGFADNCWFGKASTVPYTVGYIVRDLGEGMTKIVDPIAAMA